MGLGQSSNRMRETWDRLAAARDLREKYIADISQIKKTCDTEHGKQHVAECPDCYPQIVDKIRMFYLENPDFDWFPGREDSVADLKEMFAGAKEYKVDLEAIDSLIEAEKKQVYLQDLKSNNVIRKALEDVLEKRSLLAKIRTGNGNGGFEDLVKEIRNALNQDSKQSPDDVSKILARLNSTKTPEERHEVYLNAFFKDGPDQEVSSKNQKYLESLRDGMSLEFVMSQVLSDRKASLAAQDEEEKHKRRLGELRRARTAHELQKTKKKGGASTAGPQPADWLYNIPPCFVCSKVPNPAEVIACGLCEVLVDAQIRDVPVVFCSTACGDEGQVRRSEGFQSIRGLTHLQSIHTEESHQCASGEDCVQLHDEDVDMDADEAEAVLCKTCTSSLKVESLFCSEKCAGINFQPHRESIHVPKWEDQGDGVIDADQLEFYDEEKTKYRARNLQEHILPLSYAIEEFQQRNGLELSRHD